MERTNGPSNPLALAVLVLLCERPMHPYEIAATLRMRHAEGSIKIRYGSLYTVIEGLQRECLVAVKEIVRDGRRPERTIYEITSAGQERMRTWLRDLIEIPVKEYPKFEAALSLLPAVPPAEAVALLEARSRRLARWQRRSEPGSRLSRKSSSHYSWSRTSIGSLSSRLSGSSLTTFSVGSPRTRRTHGPGRVSIQSLAATLRRQGKGRRDLYRGGSSHGDCDPDQVPKP